MIALNETLFYYSRGKRTPAIGNKAKESDLYMGGKRIKTKKIISPRKRKFKLVMKSFILLLLSLIVIGGTIFYFKFGRNILRLREEAQALVNSSSVDTFRQNQTSLVYDSEGNVISKLKAEKDIYYLPYNEIPNYVKQAIISIEDKQFATHSGIDIKANIRAFVALIKNKGEITQGASTITQQLSRNIFLTHEVSWERKVKEIFIALELEKKYSKSQILEFYLNNIYFANGYYGIQAASRGYFSKDVDELSLGEIAFLMAIPNNPTIYDPLDYPENTLKRRDRILGQMYEDGKISEGVYKEALAEEVTLNPSTMEKQNYIDTYVLFAATEAVMKSRGFEFQYKFKNDEEKQAYKESYNEEYSVCQQYLFRSGYNIYTSIDLSIQEELQSAIDKELSGFTDVNEEGTYELQGAGVCIDNETGRVVAIVGGREQDTAGYTLNRAYQSYRQPGSAIKPLIDYLPALQSNYSANTIVEDKKLEGGPQNSDGKYLGKITLRKAVEQSRNTVAYQLFDELNPYVCMSYLYNMNFNRLTDEDYNLSASIGGFTNGVSPIEMAAAYATIENEGRYRKPTCIVKIIDSDNNVIVNDIVDEKVVYDYKATSQMTDILEGVLKSGTAKGYALKNMPSAGKTGTTNSNKDGWFVGYTPYYTTSIWVGCDIPKSISKLQGGTYPLYIWNRFMTKLHEDLSYKDFDFYEEIKPEVTEAPEETLEPEETEEPEETMEPEETIEPEETMEPEETTEVVEPEETEEPEAPEAPVVPIETPQPTLKPEITQEPITPEPTKAPETPPAVTPDDVPADDQPLDTIIP